MTEAYKIYSVGIYARLSVASSERKNESIETQIKIIKTFIEGRNDMVISGCYTDIGRTGTDFKRDGFERMLRDIRERKIDCIIVKDLSRFGRNHIETGNYIEKIFPFMGVRFIAVTDNFDSMSISVQNESLGINLKNLVNEMYARDIGVKVKLGKQIKWEQGSYTGGVPPYGYRAELFHDKKALMVEKKPAAIVCLIYERFLSGSSINEIVAWLYEERILSPSQHHKTGKTYAMPGEELQQWSRGSVKMILKNRTYTGSLVKAAGTDLQIKHNVHEAIISEDIFFKAAEKLEKASQYSDKKETVKTIPTAEDIFADIIFCADCGKKMRRISAIKSCRYQKASRVYSYNCPGAERIDDKKCASRSIKLSALTEIVDKIICHEALLCLKCPQEYEAYKESCKKSAECKKKQLKKQLSALEKRIENIKRQESEQYLRYRMKETDENSFKHMKEENEIKLDMYKKQLNYTKEEIRKTDYDMAEKNKFLNSLVNKKEAIKLTRELLKLFIDHIKIYQEHRIVIAFNFKADLYSQILERKGD